MKREINGDSIFMKTEKPKPKDLQDSANYERHCSRSSFPRKAFHISKNSNSTAMLAIQAP